ncbi:DUF2332 domain-containing protein [Flavimaricola marinus]|uniref:DUF2332 domain-containing protein n=1 Tax=Flavimaricola marinus TaxID=1819565 RepID=A0A238LFI3_9RHOB|nr:DUF2332 family protein [Flavimaricola marinus]SMY08477.1 hypothetical protein LOM8899_02629 [Flavimaricola marinus]
MSRTDRLRDALRYQALACDDLGSPFMHRLCTLLADRLQPGTPLTDRLFDWPGDLGPREASVPLRLCGALHALRLEERADLAAVYPPHNASDDALWTAVEAALHTEAAFIDRFLNSAPQTNEVRRAGALIAAGHWLHARHPMPFKLSELGASAGLNLMWDHFALEAKGQRLGPADAALTLTPDWEGDLPKAASIEIAERAGVDLNPLDPQRDALRLRAYLWPDQPHRLALTDAAISVAQAPVAKADAIDWLSGRMVAQPGQLHLIYSTIAWQYFPAGKQTEGTQLIELVGAMARPDTPLAWLAMENDGTQPGAVLTLRLWPGDLHVSLGRADFHGRWFRWDAGE